MKWGVSAHELLIAAGTGAVFGLIGYFATKHIAKYVDKLV